MNFNVDVDVNVNINIDVNVSFNATTNLFGFETDMWKHICILNTTLYRSAQLLKACYRQETSPKLKRSFSDLAVKASWFHFRKGAKSQKKLLHHGCRAVVFLVGAVHRVNFLRVRYKNSGQKSLSTTRTHVIHMSSVCVSIEEIIIEPFRGSAPQIHNGNCK